MIYYLLMKTVIIQCLQLATLYSFPCFSLRLYLCRGACHYIIRPFSRTADLLEGGAVLEKEPSQTQGQLQGAGRALHEEGAHQVAV